MNGERIYEHMVKFKLGSWTFRFWIAASIEDRSSPETYLEYAKHTRAAARAILSTAEDAGGLSPLGAAHSLADAFPRANAVEVLDPLGNGALAYNDWP